MAITDNMQLNLPTVDQTIGPLWASMIIAALQKIDAHDHSEEEGVLVTPAGILINAALDFINHQASNMASVGLSDKAEMDSDHLGSIQRIGGNLWWVNPSGAGVQLTSGSSIVSAGSGVLSPTVVSSYPYSIISSDAQSVLIIDSTAPRTLDLPPASNAMYVIVKDGEAMAQTNNITVNPDGTDLIDNVNSPYVIDTNNASVGFLSDGVSKWYVI